MRGFGHLKGNKVHCRNVENGNLYATFADTCTGFQCTNMLNDTALKEKQTCERIHDPKLDSPSPIFLRIFPQRVSVHFYVTLKEIKLYFSSNLFKTKQTLQPKSTPIPLQFDFDKKENFFVSSNPKGHNLQPSSDSTKEQEER